jgi:hypothetical protein
MYPDSIVSYGFRADAYLAMNEFELALVDLNYCQINGCLMKVAQRSWGNRYCRQQRVFPLHEIPTKATNRN